MKKKKLAAILAIMFIGLFFLAFTKGNEGNLGKYYGGKEAVIFVSRPGDAAMVANSQPPDKGIGPIKELKLGPVNQKMANDGKALFTAKCMVCHTLDQKIVGPPLRNVTKTRSPEYIMNMILNPVNMEKDDPNAKELHKKYIATPMIDQKFTQDQARALLEYLRTVAK
jgi:mono/diheme cytochrome c family protein